MLKTRRFHLQRGKLLHRSTNCGIVYGMVSMLRAESEESIYDRRLIAPRSAALYQVRKNKRFVRIFLTCHSPGTGLKHGFYQR